MIITLKGGDKKEFGAPVTCLEVAKSIGEGLARSAVAAKVDGYGHFRYLWRVMIPIASPTILTIAILSLMGAWNAYVWPNLVASGTYKNAWMFGMKEGWSMWLVSNGLMNLFSNTDTGLDHQTVRIAGSVIVTAPLFLFFLIFRKYIMRGISRSGIKG